MEKEIKIIFKWLERKNDVQVAYILGYSNSPVIDQWRRTNKIPNYQIKHLMEIIEKEKLNLITV